MVQRIQKKKSAKKQAAIVVRGKRKESVARASIRQGKGRVRINGFAAEVWGSSAQRSFVQEPLSLAAEVARRSDISVSVQGGGPISQAQAARTAICRALLRFAGEEPALKERLSQSDKFLLSEDVRRVEPKKYQGPKARARFQKSYR